MLPDEERDLSPGSGLKSESSCESSTGSESIIELTESEKKLSINKEQCWTIVTFCRLRAERLRLIINLLKDGGKFCSLVI